MQKLTLEEIQNIEMDLLDEIDSVCRQLGIYYYLAYGSLLGAARHGGFIPWDDDMDIFMMRDDYEKLVENFDALKSNDKFTLRLYRDGFSNLTYAKAVDTTTHVNMRFVKDEYSTGIWVDIFPLDFIPRDKPPLLLKEKALFYSRVFATAIPSPDRPAWQNVVLKLTAAPFGHLDPLKLAAKLDAAARKRSAQPSDYLCDIVGEPEHPRCYHRSWFSPIEVSFNDRTYYAPAGYESILEASYGDWRTPPPEDKRIPHSVEAYRLS